jgi:hypothetical protein
MRQAALPARMVAIGEIAVGDQPAQEGLADQRGQLLFAAAAYLENGGERGRGHPHPTQRALLIPGGFVEMDDLGGSYVLDQLLDHGFAGQAEFVDATLDGRHSQFEAEPVVQKFPDLAPRETAAQRQRGDESGEHRTDQAALAHRQISFAPLD